MRRKILSQCLLPLLLWFLLPEVACAAPPEIPAAKSTAAAPAPGETSKGPVTIESENITYDSETDTYHARGQVVITYDGGVLTAEDVFFNKTKNEALATGNVILKSKNDVLRGDRVDFNIESKTGVAYQGKVFFAQNHFYISGDKIEKTGEATYHIEGATATSCDGDKPDWQLAGNELDVTVEGYGTLKHMRFLTNGVPVLYMPYLIFPAKKKRQSGFLLPYVAHSDQNGWDVELPFFWAVSDSVDATFYQRYMEERGFKEGIELRYFPSKDTFGTIYGDYLNDEIRVNETVGGISRDWETDQKRWSFYLNHQTNFDPTFYFRTDIRKVSDKWYFRDFATHNYYRDNYSTTDIHRFKKVPFQADESLSSLPSTARLVKSWPLYNLTILGSYTDNFATVTNDATLQSYPEVTFTGTKRPLFDTPLNLEFSSLYGYYYRTVGQRGHLFDFKPYLSLPLDLWGYGQLTPYFGLVETVWQLDHDSAAPTDKQGSRSVYNTAANLRTEISRVFDLGGQTLQKIRHAIVPEVTYTYVPNVYQNDVPDFVSRIGEQSTVTYSLTNSFIAKMKDREGKSSYREFLRFKLAQVYDLKEASRDEAESGIEKRPFSNVWVETDFNPSQYLSLIARNEYNIYDSAWIQSNYDLVLSDSRGDAATFAYRYTQNAIEERNLSLKAVVTKTTDLFYSHRRDQLNGRDVETTYGINYHKQCWNVGVYYSEKIKADTLGAIDKDQFDKTFMVVLSLYGLGSLGNR
jgi:LPS-assembly protein